MLDYLFVSQKTLLSFFVSKRKLDGCLYIYICTCIKISMTLLCLTNPAFFLKPTTCSNFVLSNNYEIMVVIMTFN